MYIPATNQNNIQSTMRIANQHAHQSGKTARAAFKPGNHINSSLTGILSQLQNLVQQLIQQLTGGQNNSPTKNRGQQNSPSTGNTNTTQTTGTGATDPLQATASSNSLINTTGRVGQQRPLPEGVLNLPLRQDIAVKQRFNDGTGSANGGLATHFTGLAIDNNGDGQLSAGDSIELRRFAVNTPSQTISTEQRTLSTDDITAINTAASEPVLTIDDAQLARLQNALSDGNSFPGDVIDTNGDGKISVGDTLKIAHLDPARMTSPTSSFETLTQEKFDRFEATSLPGLTPTAVGSTNTSQ